MRYRVLWGGLAVVIAATIASGHFAVGLVGTGAELLLFDFLTVGTGFGVIATSRAR